MLILCSGERRRADDHGGSRELLVPTIVIAFVAGIAAMVATERRASAAVGVAIPVTTPTAEPGDARLDER